VARTSWTSLSAMSALMRALTRSDLDPDRIG
jgi:hypothetical protein